MTPKTKGGALCERDTARDDRRNEVKNTRASAPLQALREHIARWVYPEGFYFDRDTSLVIDRLTIRLESLGVRV